MLSTQKISSKIRPQVLKLPVFTDTQTEREHGVNLSIVGNIVTTVFSVSLRTYSQRPYTSTDDLRLQSTAQNLADEYSFVICRTHVWRGCPGFCSAKTVNKINDSWVLFCLSLQSDLLILQP